MSSAEDMEGEWEEERDSSAMLRYVTNLKNLNTFSGLSVREMQDVSRENKRLKHKSDSENLEKLWLRVERAATGTKPADSVRFPRGIKEDWLRDSPDAFSVEEIEGKGVGMIATRDIGPGGGCLKQYEQYAYIHIYSAFV
jgi:hypothetical protein